MHSWHTPEPDGLKCTILAALLPQATEQRTLGATRCSKQNVQFTVFECSGQFGRAHRSRVMMLVYLSACLYTVIAPHPQPHNIRGNLPSRATAPASAADQ